MQGRGGGNLAQYLDHLILASLFAPEGADDQTHGAEGGDLPSPASRERLVGTPAKLTHLAQSVREVIALPDPVGTELEAWTRPNGLRIRKLCVPIGVIGIIYESRPNVTVDRAILCLKSGNAGLLRGGKEGFHTNTTLAALIAGAHVRGPSRRRRPTHPDDRSRRAHHALKLDTLIPCTLSLSPWPSGCLSKVSTPLSRGCAGCPT